MTLKGKRKKKNERYVWKAIAAEQKRKAGSAGDSRISLDTQLVDDDDKQLAEIGSRVTEDPK